MSIFKKKDDETTADWQLYQKGKDYNGSIQYKSKADKNERFYAGDQWRGVTSANLPTPVFNIIKRIVDHKISLLLTQPLTIKYTGISTPKMTIDELVNKVPETDADGNVTLVDTMGEDLTSAAKYHWEKDKLDTLLRLALLNAALSGDMCAYTYWDTEAGDDKTLKGDFCTEIVDGINVYFGNVNEPSAQKQPYILITGRDMTENLRKQAKDNKLSQKDIDLIVSDNDTEDQAGDRGNQELETNDKCTYVLKFWKKDKKVYYRKSVKNVVIIGEKDTGLTLYPIAWGNWIPRKNSYHGEAEVTPLISGQVYYNKQMAMSQKATMDNAYQKLFYDKTRISGVSNAVGGVYPVNGSVNDIAKYLQGGQMDGNAINLPKEVLNTLYQSAGVTDALTGDMRPENTTAIIALQKAAASPLDMQKCFLYQFVEDIAEIWLDFMSKYKENKTLYVNTEDGIKIIQFTETNVKDLVFKTRIDVGASTLWSEPMQIASLDNAVQNGFMPVSIYMEALPNGIFSKKVIAAMKEYEQQKQQMEQTQSQKPPNI